LFCIPRLKSKAFSLRATKQKATLLEWPFALSCGREGIQTPNLLIRSQMLYSVELRNLDFGLQIYGFFINAKFISLFCPLK
jgi:hypothetical protein